MGGWIGMAVSAASKWLSNSSTNRANLRNTRENNAFQERMSSTAHQREVKDLKTAGLNPILSSRSAGAPVGSSAAARVEPYNIDPTQKLVQARQIQLLEAQSRKTNAEALNTELQEPYNRALHDLYDSILGGAAVTGKAVGGIATGMGMYQGAKAVSRMLKARKLKNASVSKPKLLTNLQKQKLRNLHKIKTKSRKNSSIRQVDRFINSRSKTRGKSGGGFSLRKGFGNRSGRYNKFNKF